jgi:hypothetical protein
MDKLILLGSTCNVTFATKKLNINKESGVFEWLFSLNFDDINTLLENKFENVEAATYIGSNVCIKGTDIYTSHYSLSEYNDIVKRRSLRFLDDINSGKNILFTRIEFNMFTTEEQINRFIKAIYNINPNCNFKILLIRHLYTEDDTKEYVVNEKVINKTLKKEDKIDEPEGGDIENLRNIINSCGFNFDYNGSQYGDKV